MKWELVPTPDALDLLITARNHDHKSAVAYDAALEDWIYALVSLQTGEGYGGRGNYGIARMNSGWSSRVLLGLAPAGAEGQPDPSSWWRRDVALLLADRNKQSTRNVGGLALIWTQDWPERHQVPAQNIDPWAIEVCRRIRLSAVDGTLRAERATSKAARIAAEEFNGDLGDAWAPTNRKEAGTMKLGEGRFDYRRIVDLLVAGNWEIPLAARVAEGEIAGDMILIAEALSRGKSKTDGLKTRIIPMPHKVLGAFRDRAGDLSTEVNRQMQEIKEADAALREAVALYAAGGERENVGKDQRVRAGGARQRLDAAADRAFFPSLWRRVAAVEEGPDAQAAASRAFRDVLIQAARQELKNAMASIPTTALMAPRARIRAQGRLEAALRKSGLIEEKDHV